MTAIVERIERYEPESLLRSAAMAPLAPEPVGRILEAHRDLLARSAELEATVVPTAAGVARGTRDHG